MSRSDAKIDEIRARHNHIEETWWAPDDPCVNQAHDDRGYLLAEVERLRADLERLIRRRMAEAWENGWLDQYNDRKRLNENPYQGRRKK